MCIFSRSTFTGHNKKPRSKAGLDELRELPGSAGNHFNKLPLPGTALHEAHATVRLGEQCVVPAAANILTRMKMRATLPHQDVAREHGFAAKALHTQSF